MEITPEHFEAMRALIAPLNTETVREAYRSGRYPKAEFTRDLDKRYRWDLFYAAKAYEVFEDTDYNVLEIDTALRAIVPIL